MSTPHTKLVRYDAMIFAIAACHDVDEVQEIHNKARALEVYAKQAQNVDAERKATDIRIRAEIRAGELLKQLARSTPQTANRTGKPSATMAEGSAYREALRKSHISPRTAQRYQELAAVPKDEIEKHLAGAKPTTRGILRAANGSTTMDGGSLWIWGRLRDFEREGHLARDPSEVYQGMTETMQADVKRIAPVLIEWLNGLQEAL